MKKLLVILLSIIPVLSFGQIFEEEKAEFYDFEKKEVHVGADFALQFQGLSHSADSALIPLGKGINLPTANLNINAILAPGIKVNLTTYLSSRHHVEAWVKGGYLLIDQLPFIKSDVLDRAMDYLTLKVGVMEINYGDGHFRRSDNGSVLLNPFVGNYILDAFTTAPAFEVYFRSNGIIAMGAVSGGTLRPSLVGFNNNTKVYTPYDMHEMLSFYWKGGYDKQLTDDLRFRATLSGYHAKEHVFGSLYNGDRAGSRYYLIMNKQRLTADDVDASKNHTSGNWGPGFTSKHNSLMANIFTKFRGTELFGLYEVTSGTTAFGAVPFDFNHFAIEALQRFGGQEQFFAGLRYNQLSNDNDMKVDRLQLGAGWFLNESIVCKLEYVNQNYDNFSLYGANAGFKGIMFEAGISF
jgi:hypothetical protein